jgi:hypothetical protein
MNSLQCVPHGDGVVLLVLDMDLLGNRQVGKDLASSLLLLSIKAILGLHVLHCDCCIDALLTCSKGILGLAIGLHGAKKERLDIDNVGGTDVLDEALLTKASLHIAFPAVVVELSEHGNILVS